MNNYILYSGCSYITARILATKLSLIATKNVSKFKHAPVIRYGNSDGVFADDTTLNSKESISLVSNSLEFSSKLKEAGFRTTVYTPIKDVDLSAIIYPVLIRRKYHHGGKDIIVANSQNELERYSHLPVFVVPFEETTDEFGVHIINGNVVRIFRKVAGSNPQSSFIRSAYMGYHYSIVNFNNGFNVLKDIALRAFELVGLNFGRMDIGYNAEKKRYVIFEINSAPGLNTSTAEVYAAFFREKLYGNDS